MVKLTIDENRCKGCGLCVRACPKKLLELAKQKLNEKDPLSPESFIATIRPLLLTSGNGLSAVAGYGSDFAALTPNA